MKVTKLHCSALLLGLLTLLVSACGSSNDYNDTSAQQNNNGQNSAFVGNYLGANNLNGGQTSVLTLNVATNGQATGTLAVSDPVANQSIDISPASYPVSGSVNLTNGTFNLTGSFPGGLNFSISGALPTGNSQGSYAINVNGETFTGVIQSSSLGTPNPPNHGGNDGDQHLILGGTLSNFVFTPAGSYNGQIPPVGTGSLLTGAVVTNSDTENLVSISLSEVTGTDVTALVFGVVTHNGEELKVGQSYPVATSSQASGSTVSLSQSTGVTINSAWAPVASTTGSVTITALTASSVELDFSFSGVGPNSEVSGNDALGTFSTSGHVAANFSTAP